MSLDKGSPCPVAGILANYVVTKISSWRGRYQRLFALLEGGVVNVDPLNFQVTNMWRYGSEVVDFSPSVSAENEFTMTVSNGRRNEVLKFGCERRSELLTDLAKFGFGRTPDTRRPFMGLKITRSGGRSECILEVRPYGLAQVSMTGEQSSEWSFKEVQSINPAADDASAVILEVHGRLRMFALRDRAGFLAAASEVATKLGRTGTVSTSGISVTDFRTSRVKHGNDGSPVVAEFDLTKVTPRHPTPRARRLVLTETRIVERDSSSYQVVSARPYAAVLAVVRPCDEPQHVVIQFRDGSARTYVSPRRDALVAALLDGVRVGGGQPLIQPLPSAILAGDLIQPPPLRLSAKPSARPSFGGVSMSAAAAAAAASEVSSAPSLDDSVEAANTPPHKAGPAELDSGIEKALVAYLDNAGRSAGGSGTAGGADMRFVRTCELFNATVEPLGIASDTGRGKFTNAVAALLGYILRAAKGGEMSSASALCAMLGTLYRMCGAHACWKLLGTSAEIVPTLIECMRHPDPCVVSQALGLLQRLCRNPRPPPRSDGDGEVNARRVLMRDDMRECLAELLDHYTSGTSAAAAGSDGTIVVLALARLLEAVLVSASDTTPPDVGEHLMQLVASRYMALLTLFRLQVPTAMECAAMLIRGIVNQADVDTCRLMQRAALSTGILLRHFFNAIFAASSDQRFVSRYLVELWCAGNPTARTLFRHMLPPGFLVYLETPKMSEQEQRAMEAMEIHLMSSSSAASTDGESLGGGLASRLRSRLEAADRAALNKVKRRLAKLKEDQQGGGQRRFKFFNRKSREQKRREAEEAERAALAAIAAEAEIVSGKIQEGKPENFAIFFHMIMQEHDLPDLIWSAQTRGELRAALEAELREIEREIELGGTYEEAAEGEISNRTKKPSVDTTASDSTAAAAAASVSSDDDAASTSSAPAKPKLQFAWNYSEFEVAFPSLAEELRVGEQYLRVFLDGGRRAVADLRNPDRFFDALYRRVLRERAPSLRGMCLKGMALVYEQHWKTIGPFEDTDYILWLISEENDNGVRDRLLLLAEALALHPINCEKLINGDCLELVVDLMTTAHTMSMERRVTPQLKVGSGLLLRDATATEVDSMGGSGLSSDGHATSHGGSSSLPKQATIQVWHYRADPRDVPEGEKLERGPYSLQEMHALGQARQLRRNTLVWAAGMREWVRLDSMRALMWTALSPGEPVLTPTERGLLCIKLLLRLVRLRPSVDGEGVPVRPVPKAKRVLSSARCMPHIAQAILTGDPDIVDTAAELICDLVAYNPAATVKLYTTGVFFYALGYGGSNFEKLARMLYITHLRQSFFSEAAALGRETTLARRSILGALLPESMICVLENRGAKAFAEAFMSNVDTPEVIWKYEMRAHLLDMIGQHLGELPARLHANPATVYDYCPIPRVTFKELDKEMWCANFYLGNLTDEVRFPDWPIDDPVLLLRALLDTWREETTKEGEVVVSLDDAFAQLGLEPGSDDKAIRKAYRKLAMKFHPDKNPAGRDTFEKIQAAYEALTSPRPEVAAAGGPDPLVLLLVIRCQCILFKRSTDILKDYKYAGYPPIMQGIDGLSTSDSLSEGMTGKMAEALTRLIYLTCLTSPRNSDELIREMGVEKLLGLLTRCVMELDPREEATPPDLPPPDSGPKLGLRVLENVVHTLSGLSAMPDARPRFEADLYWAKPLVATLKYTRSPATIKYTLDAISRMAVSVPMQQALVDAGIVWRLLPLLFRFDITLERETIEAAATDNAQKAANLHAKMAVRALSRLGGYLEEKQSTPENLSVKATMNALLTPVLARRLSRSTPDSLLATLVGHEETSTVMWNNDMRKELAAFVKERLAQLDATGEANMEAGARFRFAALADELCLEGLYVRHYVTDPHMVVEAPYRLAIGLLRYVAYSACTPRVRLPGADSTGTLCPLADAPPAPRATEECSPADTEAMRDADATPPELSMRHVRLALRALHLLIVNVSNVEDELAKSGKVYLASLFAALRADDGGITDEDVKNRGTASTTRGAASTGRSAGAGGARSSAAAPDAPLRELVMTVIASASTSETFCRAVAEQFLLPTLVRELANDPAGVGPVLRTMVSHSYVVAELRRTGALFDVVTLFAGGVASGPAPGKPGGPPIHEAPRPTVPRGAREEAGALLSAMCSESTEGPPVFMNLSQLMPDGLARAVKESVSGATMAGGPVVGTAGQGVGAQGAGTMTGTLGQAVRFFDGDHETPELIWDVVCRHELRVALNELTAGLTKLRTSAERAGKAGGFDGCPWTMPATFSIRFSPMEGELRVGGVFVRLFIKEPTFPLRDPKGFLEACLRRLQQESESLIGMTSEDPEAVERAAKAAAAEAREEAERGGFKASSSEESGALVVRGEDVMTQVTHAIVCLLRARPSFIDHLAALGFIPKLVKLVKQSSTNKARYNIGVQCVRVIEVISANNACVAQLGKQRAVETLVASLSPLPRDASFTLEALRKMLESDSKGATPDHALILAAIQVDLITLLINLLEKDDVSHLVDASSSKVHAVTILKLLENDTIHGIMAQGKLGEHGGEWSRYKHQKHDMFLSHSARQDYFLADVETGPSRLLKNAPEYSGVDASSSKAARSGDPHVAAAARAGPLLLTSGDDTVPPPAPDALPFRGGSMGGFQPPAPADPPARTGFGGFQAPAPAEPEFSRPRAPVPAPTPAPAPAPGSDPFADLLGSTAAVPAPAPAPAPARSGGGGGLFDGMTTTAPAPVPAASDDPFADLLDSTASKPTDLFAGMSTAPAPAPTPAPAPAPSANDPFAGLLD
jgi:DnaJ homolog subfamily C member 13